MAVSTQARTLGAVVALLLGALHAPDSLADAGYAITSLNTPVANFVTTGDTVKMNVTAPSTALALAAIVKLNGYIVNFAFLPDATPGSKTGTVPGLHIGANTFNVYTSKTSQVPVATYVVERGTAPVIACASIASIASAQFPIPSTSITLTQSIANGAVSTGGVPLPAHCLVRGFADQRIGTDGVNYATGFELRLPANWSGRFLFQGGGGTEGSVPSAFGSGGGNATPSPVALAQGYAVVTQDGGHQNAVLTAAGKTTLGFLLEETAFKDWSYGAPDKAYQTAQFLMSSYYGRAPDRNYYAGCSTGGRQGMAFSQRFPSYFDGLVIGDPVFELTGMNMNETSALQAVLAIVPRVNGVPQFFQSIPVADQNLITSAILDACDALDGVVDGVVGDPSVCTFDPATHIFSTTGQPLQCVGPKTPTCLSPEQVGVVKKINQGPRTSGGQPVFDFISGLTVLGWPYDGGSYAPNSLGTGGIATRTIGVSATSLPTNINLGTNQLGYYFLPPDLSFVPYLSFNFDTDPARFNPAIPIDSVSTDLSALRNRGSKVLYYHGSSDGGPSIADTTRYYNSLIAVNGGLAQTQSFARFFPVPNMGHCGNGPSTDTFDPLAVIVNWVENRIAPDRILATGTRFQTAPTTRTRPLCPYPATPHYTGPAGGNVGDPNNFTCQ